MQDWDQIQPAVEQVLRKQRFTNSGDHNGDPCFLSAYQIAVLVNKINPSFKGDLPIGGKGMGGDENRSFAQQIAWFLSKDINDNGSYSKFDRQFFSLDGLDIDSFKFNDGNVPSMNEFSMFRLKSFAT